MEDDIDIIFEPTIDRDNFSLMPERMQLFLNYLFFPNSYIPPSSPEEQKIQLQEEVSEIKQAYDDIFDGDLDRFIGYMIEELFSEENTLYKDRIVIESSCYSSNHLMGYECSEDIRTQDEYIQGLFVHSPIAAPLFRHITIGPSMGMSYEVFLLDMLQSYNR